MRTAKEIRDFMLLNHCGCILEDGVDSLQAFLDSSPEQEPMVLPEFEEWVDGLELSSGEGMYRVYKFKDKYKDTFVRYDQLLTVYNSLKSMVRPITDEDVVGRWNRLKRDRRIQRMIPSLRIDGEWDEVSPIEIYRLKPQEPEKEPWEVAYSEWTKNHRGPMVDRWVFKEIYEAATKGGGDE